MEQPPGLKNKVSEMLAKWCAAENKRGIYGFDSPQTKAARDELAQVLAGVLSVAGKVTVVRKEADLEVLGQNWNILASTLHAKGMIQILSSSFEKLRVNSISFQQGLTRNELDKLFYGLNMGVEELEKQDGLQGYLQKNNVTNIQVDQMHFKLLKEGEGVGVKDEKLRRILEEMDTVTQDEKAATKVSKEEFSFCWKNYMEGHIGKDGFSGLYEQFIRFAKDNPSELVGVVRDVVEKQKDIEAAIADIEKKLRELGFAQDQIKSIREKLRESKKVAISEGELARLKKIEKDFTKTLEERVEGALQEIKKINQKLTDEKERMGTILRQSSQGVIVINKDGKILSLNSLAEKALGVSLRDGQQKDLKDIIKEGRMLSITSRWQDEADEFTPKKIEMLAPDEKVKDAVAESSAIVENEDGTTIGMVSSLQNIVEREEFQKRRNEMMDVLSHDLRAPLHAAKQSLAVLMGVKDFAKGLGKKQREFFTICQRNIEKMEKLVNTIMDVRQLETGKIILRKDSTDIGELIEESVSSLKSWAEDKTIELTTHIEKVPAIKIDSERVYQVVTNLISNALKFTSTNGSVQIRVKTKGEAKSIFLQVAVIDSGIGIKKSDLKRIFNKYEQVSLQAPKAEISLGLGLAICKSIIELHDGRIWAESEEGKGSTFIFTLPYQAARKQDK
ncbi:MAG: hypothetical protein JSW40_00555 [Candidatus Omnitrophota bacterium]|nr:MAG: hypothetical protein JSW40_00555 [Candidatus Omnitrophota bacterium]